MAIFNMGRAKSVLDEAMPNVLGDDPNSVQAQQPAYQNAYQSIVGKGPTIGETPDWFQKQRMTFFKPTDIDTNAVDLYTSTSGQARDWRDQGQTQYNQFQKQYGSEAPWVFRNISEGGLGVDASSYNLLGNLGKKYAYRGDLGANATLNARYGGQPGVATQRLEAEFNPITGQQEGAFDLMNTYNQGPAQDPNRKAFGNLINTGLASFSPAATFMNFARQGGLGSGIQRGVDRIDQSNPTYEMQNRATDKMYGYMSPSQQRMIGGIGALSTPNMPNQYSAPTSTNLAMSAYKTRFINPYQKYPNPYNQYGGVY